MDWDKLKIFHAVAEAGSFTSATVNLNLSQSAISRQIQSLEDDLKVKLFERHARGLTLTENGEYVFKTAHEVISKLKEVETSLGDKKNKPSGKLTVTTVVSFGTTWLTPRIQEFMELNPEIEIVEHNIRLDVSNALELLSDWDVVIDGTDNFPTRYTINDACEILGKPWIFGSIHRFEGQVTVFNFNDGPNYRDLFPNAPPPELAPNCAEAGVLGVLPGIVGSVQSAEAIKLILGIGDLLSGQLMVIDAKSMKTRSLQFDKIPEREKITEMSEQLIMQACQSQEVREEPPIGHVLEITPAEFVERRSQGWNPFLLDVRRENEAAIVSLPGTDLRIEHITVPAKAEDLPKDCDLVVYCRSGGRSDAVARWLGQSGWDRARVWNMVGGIHLWADQIDSAVPKY